MRKVLVIAAREYRAAVRSKGFIVTLILMPVLMAASVGVQVLFKKYDDTSEKRVAVVDRSPGAKVADALKADVAVYNAHLTTDPRTGERTHPGIALEVVPPPDPAPEAVLALRAELSRRVENGGLEAVVEVGPDVYDPRPDPAPELARETQVVRWQAKQPGETFISRYLEGRINDAVQRHRLARAGIDPAAVRAMQQPVPLRVTGLTRLDRQTGKVEDAALGQRLTSFFLPAVLIVLMIVVVMIGATPAMQGIVEEKGQRIVEVLLGSVTPFQLMTGKLLGVVGVSLTMAAVYLAGALFVAHRYELTDALTPGVIAWFALFLVLALLIYGSLFIAIGAAAADIKDTQTLLLPVMIIAFLPFFALRSILDDPNGNVAVACSFFPFATPMVLVARQAVPPGVPAWQMAAGILLVLATTALCVWAAGRIFRVGILMQGKGAKLKDMARWVVKG